MAIRTAVNRALTAITALPTAAALTDGNLTLLKTLNGGASTTTISFVNGSSDVVLDSTYSVYLFKYINIHADANTPNLEFNLSVDSGSNYNVTKTSSAFATFHKEDDSGTSLAYNTGNDLAQSTSGQRILFGGLDNANDGNGCATLHLFDPSSTTFVKHFICNAVKNSYHPYAWNTFVAGYGNTTSAVDAIQFSLDSGNIETGTIKMYGIK
tara:strand:+ start:49 stop:681 length:633 start_codon:yes stop_codon:yes gene_type:complete